MKIFYMTFIWNIWKIEKCERTSSQEVLSYHHGDCNDDERWKGWEMWISASENLYWACFLGCFFFVLFSFFLNSCHLQHGKSSSSGPRRHRQQLLKDSSSSSEESGIQKGESTTEREKQRYLLTTKTLLF